MAFIALFFGVLAGVWLAGIAGIELGTFGIVAIFFGVVYVLGTYLAKDLPPVEHDKRIH